MYLAIGGGYNFYFLEYYVLLDAWGCWHLWLPFYGNHKLCSILQLYLLKWFPIEQREKCVLGQMLYARQWTKRQSDHRPI